MALYQYLRRDCQKTKGCRCWDCGFELLKIIRKAENYHPSPTGINFVVFGGTEDRDEIYFEYRIDRLGYSINSIWKSSHHCRVYFTDIPTDFFYALIKQTIDEMIPIGLSYQTGQKIYKRYIYNARPCRLADKHLVEHPDLSASQVYMAFYNLKPDEIMLDQLIPGFKIIDPESKLTNVTTGQYQKIELFFWNFEFYQQKIDYLIKATNYIQPMVGFLADHWKRLKRIHTENDFSRQRRLIKYRDVPRHIKDHPDDPDALCYDLLSFYGPPPDFLDFAFKLVFYYRFELPIARPEKFESVEAFGQYCDDSLIALTNQIESLKREFEIGVVSEKLYRQDQNVIDQLPTIVEKQRLDLIEKKKKQRLT